ncbi:MAG: corrinoid protein [Pseudomonadota bacterium]
MSIQDIFNAVISYDRLGIAALTEKEITAGTSVQRILNQGLIAPMDEVGRKFSEGVLFMPEMMMAGQTMKEAMKVLKPHLVGKVASPAGTVVIATVKGDLHDIGKNLVALMLEGGGFTVHDLGVDVPTEKLVEEARRTQADIVALSALLTTTMPAMAETTAALKTAPREVRVIVGGAPVTEAFAQKIGADGYAENGPKAVELARTLLGPR